MLKEPYETTLLRGHPVKKITEQLEVHFIEGTLSPVLGKDDVPAEHVFEILPGVTGIDALVAPKLFDSRQGQQVVFDARASKRARRDGPPAVVSPSDYRFQRLDAALTWLWSAQGATTFSQIGILPIKVYSRWVTDNIVRRLALDPLSQIRISVITAFYFMSQFLNEPVDEARKFGMANVIGRALALPPATVSDALLPLGEMPDIHALIEAIKTHGGSERLAVLNHGLLYTLLAPSWFGANSRFIVGVAVEYVPTFIAMLYTAYNDRGYHKTYFAKMAEAADKRNLGREVVVAVDALTRGVTDV